MHDDTKRPEVPNRGTSHAFELPSLYVHSGATHAGCPIGSTAAFDHGGIRGAIGESAVRAPQGEDLIKDQSRTPDYVIPEIVNEIDRTITLYVETHTRHGPGFFEPLRLLFCWYDFLGKLYSGRSEGARQCIVAWLMSEPMMQRNERYAQTANELYSDVRTYFVHARHPGSGAFSYENPGVPYLDGSKVTNLERDENGTLHFYIPVLLGDLKRALTDYLRQLKMQASAWRNDGPGTLRAFTRGLKLAHPLTVVRLADDSTNIPEVRQDGKNWCIPAAIEFALRFVFIDSVKQEDLVLDFCRHEQGSKPGPLQGGTKDLAKLKDSEVLELAKDLPLRGANLKVFISALERVSPGTLKKAGYAWKTERHPPKVARGVVNALRNELPALLSVPAEYISGGQAGNYHVMPLLEFNEQSGQAVFWEPIDGKRINAPLGTVVQQLKKRLDCAYIVRG